MSSKIIYDPQTGFYINTETGEILEDYFEPVEGIRRLDPDTRELKIQNRKIDIAVHDYGLHTYIGEPARRFINRRYRKLKKLNRVMRVKGSEPLIKVIEIAYEYARRLNLPKYVLEDTVMRLRQIYAKSPSMFRAIPQKKTTTIHYIIGATMVASARSYGIPVTYKDMLKKLFNKDYKHGLLTKIMQLASKYPQLKPKPIRTEDLIKNIITAELKMPELVYPALRMWQAMNDDPKLSGRSRRSIVAGLVYILGRILGYNITQRELAQKLGITEVAVRHAIQTIIKNHTIMAEVG